MVLSKLKIIMSGDWTDSSDSGWVIGLFFMSDTSTSLICCYALGEFAPAV